MIIDIKSVNWHITSRCNYNCKFCYMQNFNHNTLEISTAKNILNKIRSLSIDKINFVGGEPLSSPVIYDIMKAAKRMEFTVSITTNGSLLNEKIIHQISPYVDWIGLSVDSAHESIEKKLGRGIGNHVKHIKEISKIIKAKGIKLKINTTVTKYTINEDMTELIREILPNRWKVFQFLYIKEQNDHCVAELSITDDEFVCFKELNKSVELDGIKNVVFENCYDMLDSYFMISPSGNVLINHNQIYSEIPLDYINIENISDIINHKKYAKRGGLYDWN